MVHQNSHIKHITYNKNLALSCCFLFFILTDSILSAIVKGVRITIKQKIIHKKIQRRTTGCSSGIYVVSR